MVRCQDQLAEDGIVFRVGMGPKKSVFGFDAISLRAFKSLRIAFTIFSHCAGVAFSPFLGQMPSGNPARRDRGS